jgi:ActR/RegA family two-component response regulator
MLSNRLNLEQLVRSAAVQATPLQKAVVDLELQQGSQLFILEDVSGAGKIETALLCVPHARGDEP